MRDSKDSKRVNALAEIVLSRLSPEDLALLRGEVPGTDPSCYDAALSKVSKQFSVLEDQISRNRERVRNRYAQLEEQPEHRRRLLFENSPPPLLLALAYGLMKQSYTERFDNVRRSLQLAELAVEAATQVKRTGYLASEVAADLEAEALVHLGNARRINSDLTGSEEAFTKAEDCRASGTFDRTLHADWLRHVAMLRNDQGRAREAGRLLDREIALRRLLGDEEKLGEALINRGWVSPWFEPLQETCEFLMAGALLVTHPRTEVLALLPLAEALARKGHGVRAWMVACRIEAALVLANTPELRVYNRAIKGLALRVLGEFEDAERELAAVRDEFVAKGQEIPAAIASLELACICASQGRIEEIKKLATYAHAIFVRERAQPQALRAVLTLRQAAKAGRVTEQLAVEVVNFVVRSRHDRSLRFVKPRTL